MTRWSPPQATHSQGGGHKNSTRSRTSWAVKSMWGAPCGSMCGLLKPNEFSRASVAFEPFERVPALGYGFDSSLDSMYVTR